MKQWKDFAPHYADYHGKSALFKLEQEINTSKCSPDHFAKAVNNRYHRALSPTLAIGRGIMDVEQPRCLSLLESHPHLLLPPFSTSSNDHLIGIYQLWAITSGLELSDSEMLRRILRAS
jgi:hypothetical protein